MTAQSLYTVAEAFLKGYLAGSADLPRPLPTITELAAMSGISRTTMGRVVAQFAPGSARDEPQDTQAGLNSGAEEKKGRSGGRTNAARESLERDILSGGYDRDVPLPSLTDLAKRYGVNFRTIRKAARELANDGLIEPYKRTFRVKRLPLGSRHSTVLCFVLKTETGGIVFGHRERAGEMFKAIESACTSSGVSFTLVPYLSKHVQSQTFAPYAKLVRKHLEEKTVLGAIVFPLGINRANNLVDLLQRDKIRLTIMDELGLPHPVTEICRAPRTLVIRQGYTPKSPRDMAQYLLELGHRHIAYLTASNSELWSRNRFDGLAAVFGPAGGSVSRFGASYGPMSYTVTHEISPGLTHEIDRLMEAGFPELAANPSRRYRPHELFQLSKVVSDQVIGRMMQQAFEEALACRNVTAWVADNDATALKALDFLNNAGVAVPKQLSVVGFDNTVLGREADLTTYDFRPSRIAVRAVSHLLDPYLPAHNEGTAEIDGIVIPRGTTAGPRRQQGTPVPLLGPTR